MNKELIELITNNPDLPIFAFVDSDVVCDDACYRWLGSFGSAEIKEYAKVDPYGWNEKITVFKDDTEEYLEYLLENEFKDSGLYVNEVEAKEIIDHLDYKKAIFVNVDLPDDL